MLGLELRRSWCDQIRQDKARLGQTSQAQTIPEKDVYTNDELHALRLKFGQAPDFRPTLRLEVSLQGAPGQIPICMVSISARSERLQAHERARTGPVGGGDKILVVLVWD